VRGENRASKGGICCLFTGALPASAGENQKTGTAG
jgi:hypothetical protein